MQVFAHFKDVMALQGMKPGMRMAVALSGGPDSTALASLVARWWSEDGETASRVSAGHSSDPSPLDSGRGGLSYRVYSLIRDADCGAKKESGTICTRRPNSRQEAEQALDCARGLGLECHYERLCWEKGTPEKAKAMEEARHKRYAALYASCIASGSQVLITGHNAGDQAETFLGRFFRSSGIAGLSGMRVATLIRPGAPGPLFWMDPKQEASSILLLRPLLGVPKALLEDYCATNELPYTKDPTNEDTFFARARMRKFLHEKPGMVEDIHRLQASCMTASTHKDQEAFRLLCQAWIKEEGSSRGENRVALDILRFKASNSYVVTRLVSVLLQTIAGKQHAPRSKGIPKIAHGLLSGRLARKFDVYGCQISPIPKTKGTKVWIAKAP